MANHPNRSKLRKRQKMTMLDKEKVAKVLEGTNAQLKAEGKTLQQVADEQKTKALEGMKALHSDPKFAANRG
jgi:hypothetical protein